MLNNIIRIETKAGEPITAGSARLIPFSRSVHIQIPGLPGGVIWNRPISVAVIDADGNEQILPVLDVTRQVQLFLLGACLAGAAFILLISRLRKR